MTTPTIPQLENGDHPQADEFLRRQGARPGIQAQLIDGIVYLSNHRSQEHYREHQAQIVGWLGAYYGATPVVRPSITDLIRLDGDNVVEPDATLSIPRVGWRRGPELVIEVTASSVSIECHRKARVYQRNAIPEYIVCRVEDEAIDWLRLEAGRYEPIDQEGEVLKSVVFPGLWLDPAALLRLDTARILEVLHQGLATPKHAALAARQAEAKER